MATIGSAYVQILPSADGMSNNLKQAMSAPSQQAGAQSGTIIGSAMKKYITAAAIGMAIKKSVEEGAKLEQSLGGVETLYKKHADTVIKNANNAYKTAGLSANSYMEQSTMFAASLLQSLGGNTKKAASYADMAIKDMSDNANKFGTYIGDIQNAYQGFSKQNYTMLDNLKLGYGGTKTEMERLLRDAEKLSGQKYDISSLADVYDAIHVVQENLGITGTTAKEAASTLSGSFSSMKAAADNFLGSLALGDNVGPSLEGLVSSATTFLFNNLVPALLNITKSLPEALFTGLRTAIPQFMFKIPALIEQSYSSATGIVNKVSEFISGLADNAANNPQLLLSGAKIVLKIGTGIIKGAGSLVTALLKLFLIAIPKAMRSGLTYLLNTVTSLLRKGAAAAVNAAKTKFAAIKDAILSPLNKAKSSVQTVINKIKGIFNKVKLKLKMSIPKLSVSGGKAPWGIGGKGKLPSIHVRWAAKGGIVDGATLIGAGEKGKEAIVPLDPFWQKLDGMTANTNQEIDYDKLAAAIAAAVSALGISTTVNIDGKKVIEAITPILTKTIEKMQARDARKYGYV